MLWVFNRRPGDWWSMRPGVREGWTKRVADPSTDDALKKSGSQRKDGCHGDFAQTGDGPVVDSTRCACLHGLIEGEHVVVVTFGVGGAREPTMDLKTMASGSWIGRKTSTIHKA